MIENKLSYEEEMILFLYNGLYKKKYSINDNNKNEKDILTRHINVQKANYIFNLLGIYVGDFYFGWGEAGPYSTSLQKTIRELDKKNNMIENYYNQFKKQKVLIENKLFDKEQIKYVNKVFNSLNPITMKENGSESLASLAFININYYPNDDYNTVIKELLKLKPYLKKFNNKQAWKKLKELSIV